MRSLNAIDEDARSLLITRVARYIGKNDELDDVMNDAKRIAYTIQTDDYDVCRESVSASDVEDVAEDALYFREHGELP